MSLYIVTQSFLKEKKELETLPTIVLLRFFLFLFSPLSGKLCHAWAFRLGATPLMELMIAAGKAVPGLQLEHGLAVERVYTGSFMTSLDMAGMFMLTRMYAYIKKLVYIITAIIFCCRIFNYCDEGRPINFELVRCSN